MKYRINFLDKMDLGKHYPEYIDKNIIRVGFVVVLIIQLIALIQTGFNFNSAWVECKKNECSNPFYEATGELCEQNLNLCEVKTLYKGDILGNKPPLFARMANFLSWIALAIAGIVNYKVCKKRRDTKW